MLVRNISDLIIEMVPVSQRLDHVCHACQKRVPAKYKITNPVTKESRIFCNLCYMKAMHNLEIVHKMMEDSFFHYPIYIRIGEIPENKISTYELHGETTLIKGISVYSAEVINGDIMANCPSPESYTKVKLARNDPNEKVYLVTGTVIGTGVEGEPILTRIRILESRDHDKSFFPPINNYVNPIPNHDMESSDLSVQ